jgi:hypothetical protein
MDQDLDVGLRSKIVSFVFQLTAQLAIVEDLAVATQRQRPVFVEQRLIACFEIDDPQAARADSGVWFDKIAVRIRTAMNERIRHVSERALVDATGAI